MRCFVNFQAPGARVLMMQLLLDAGASVHDSDGSGETALHYAAAQGRCDSVSLLLRYGANVNAACRRGVTPLMKSDNLEVLRLLLDAGGDPLAEDLSGRSARSHLANMPEAARILNDAIQRAALG
jgi:ankyrin repeat protein